MVLGIARYRRPGVIVDVNGDFGMDRRAPRYVGVTDEAWKAFRERLWSVTGLAQTDKRIDDALEVALECFVQLDHDEALKRLQRFEPPTAAPDPAEATAAPASS